MTTSNTSTQPDSHLPSFIERRPDGVFFNPAILQSGETLVEFIDRLFAGGARFSGLDYGMFQQVIFNLAETPDAVFLAKDIVRFPPQRQALYKGVKIMDGGQAAEYVFEPATLEFSIDEPVYGEPGEDGVAPIIKYVQQVKTQPTKLEFDEFVADMWLKGVRFGISVDKVCAAIDKGDLQRCEIARERLPTESRDAEIIEASDALHRDNSPKLLPDGRANLRRFANRFPHVAKDARLLKKILPVQGKPGHKVNGDLIPPKPPKDVDLYALVGPGTHVEHADGSEFIVADKDGFLTLDLGKNLISVTETIENHGGISLRTTGDLTLSVDEFVEHGEVQEGRLVEGRHMTFKSDVYGDIRSLEGHIRIESNLSGGSARSQGGDVAVVGRASNAVLEAFDGKLSVRYAEGCTLIGKHVEIDRAIGCQIVAEELHMGTAEGCGILAKKVVLATSNARKDKENIITVVVPDLTLFDREIVASKQMLSGATADVAACNEAMQKEKSDPDLVRYLTISNQARQGTIHLTDAQKDQLKKMGERFAPAIRKLQSMETERQALIKSQHAAQAQLNHLQHARSQSGENVECAVQEVVGNTVVQKLSSTEGVRGMRTYSPAELKTRLHSMTAREDRLFYDDHGKFHWQFKLPD